MAAYGSEDENLHPTPEDIVKINPALQSETDDVGVTHYRLNLLHGLKETTLLR